jgi:tryptophan-rich sensory protein
MLPITNGTESRVFDTDPPANPVITKQLPALVSLLAICLGTAALGGYLTSLSVGTWYTLLNKPSWNPPNWVFGPVWTTLYITMAVAAWLVWRKSGNSGRRLSLAIFGVQLFLNSLWSALFFGLRNPGLAMVDLVLLWLAIVATITAFRRIDPRAAILLTPYLAWVTYAATLNWSIWQFNP